MTLIKTNKNLSDILKISLLFFLMIYAFIPFETTTSSMAYKIHIFFMILIVLYALYMENFKIKINRLGIVTFFIIIIFILVTLLFNNVTFWPRAPIYIIAILFALIVASIIQKDSKFKYYFLSALQWLIGISILFLFLQILYFAITKDIILFHEMFFPFSEARIGTDKAFKDLFRMGGLYIEPGTYSNWMYCFLILYMLLIKKISSPFIIIGSISLILSYSTWGMIFGTFLLTLSLSNKLITSSWKIKSFIALIFLFLSYFYITNFSKTQAVNFATNKLTVGNASSDAKYKAYEAFFNNIENFLFIGQGFEPEIGRDIASFQDAGIILNLAVTFGILYTIVILLIFITSYLKYNKTIMFIASLPIFMGKLYFYDPVFWLIIFIVIFNGFNNAKKEIK
jgi:hypothetical protein